MTEMIGRVARLRTEASAWSSAANTMCNQWNLLPRTPHWAAMTGEFQKIWESLKQESDELHKLAEKLELK